MKRRRIPTALVVSLLLHAVLGFVAWKYAKSTTRTVASAPAPIELELVTVAPVIEEKEKPRPPPVVARPKRSLKPPPTAPRQPAPAPPASTGAPEQLALGAQSEGPSSAPASPAPRKLELFPRLPLSGGMPVASAPPTGRTIRPDDPSLSPEVKRLEEEHRVGGRVGGWAKDALAEARAGAGAGGGHPYLGGVGTAMRSGLRSAKGGTQGALGANPAEVMFNRWTGAMEDYAKTGNPGIQEEGLAPTQSEKLKQMYGQEAQWVQGLSQGAQTVHDLQHGKPLLSLTFELRQKKDGHFKSGTILEKSGSDHFDAFVMRVVPKALEELGPPPEEVLRGRDEVRSVWRIEGWQVYTQLETQLPGLGIEGIPLDALRRQLAKDKKFDFRARLLRAY